VSFNLADLFEAAVDAAPDREVLVIGERRLTYQTLEQRTNALANHLAAAGIGAGDTVGLHLTNSTEYIEGMFAAFKLRAIPVNVNYRYVERELAHLYDDAAIAGLIYHRQFGPRVAAVNPSVKALLTVEDGSGERLAPGATDYDEALARSSQDRPVVEGRSSDDLYITYTGGTTGLPKGVVWRHEDIFKAAMGGGDPTQSGDYVSGPDQLGTRIAEMGDGIVALATPPLMHASAHWLACHNLFTGGKVVMVPQGQFDPPTIWTLVAQEGVMVLVIIGDAMAKPLLDELSANPDRYDTSTLFVIASSGALLSPVNKQRLTELLPDRMVMDAFGSSETGVLGPRGQDGGGFTLNDQTAVLDENGRPIAPGSGGVGRLARRGHVPLRYLGDPAKSAQTFIEVDGERWALIGDEATVEADGSVKVLGRGSQCINTGGEKVYPEEVEAPLRAHPAIEDVVIVGVPDERWGERVIAIVQAVSGATIDLETLQAHARQHVAGYKIPRDVITVERVVRSPAGKPDYRWAKQLAAERLA
jgi:acyl-CoA synthetase (AMP-forming)/AMP-acid ligase II